MFLHMKKRVEENENYRRHDLLWQIITFKRYLRQPAVNLGVCGAVCGCAVSCNQGTLWCTSKPSVSHPWVHHQHTTKQPV